MSERNNNGMDIVGKTFNYLTVLEPDGRNENSKEHERMYKCKCVCGNEIRASRKSIMRGLKKSCGCKDPNKFKDLTGMKFERLTVIERDPDDYVNPTSGVKSPKWICRCDCGNIKSVRGTDLKTGNVTSCGCYRVDRMTKHGMRTHGNKERLYTVWLGMRSRCNNPNDSSYYDHGAIGIKVCEEWNDYINFREWAYSHGYDENALYGECTLDRIDNTKDYCPENCRFVSMKVQGNNKSNNIFVTTSDGRRLTAAEYADEQGISRRTIYDRVKKGWSNDEIINIDYRRRTTIPQQQVYTLPHIPNDMLVEFNGFRVPSAQWDNAMEFPLGTVRTRITNGMNVRDAILTPLYGNTTIPGIIGFDDNGNIMNANDIDKYNR